VALLAIVWGENSARVLEFAKFCELLIIPFIAKGGILKVEGLLTSFKVVVFCKASS
jgi:hypothetical protein